MVRFGTTDIILIGAVAAVTSVQMLRGFRDFSRVFYETLFFIAAAMIATHFYRQLHELTHWSLAVTFGGTFLALAAVGFFLALLLNLFLAFGFGALAYFVAFLLGITCAYVTGHVFVKSAYIAFDQKRPALTYAMHRSWMARDLYYFRTFREALGVLRRASYKNN